jgi:hypothetical protein
MNAICKEIILSKTHQGLNIYSHILRLYYPDDVVLRLVGRDCGLCRNPFNSSKETLHIFIEKEISCQQGQNSNLFEVMPSAADIARSEYILGNALDKELARHEDSETAIPAGDAFDFAELHYKQQGDKLLQTLNKELFLRIGEQWSFYKTKPKSPNSPTSPPLGDLGGFSFFKAPITNTKPHSEATLRKVFNAIKGDYYRERTQKLRTILAAPSPSNPEGLAEGNRAGGEAARQFKAANFDYCTFSGVFTTRNDKALVKHSDLLCLDFDHLQNVEQLRFQLLQDEYFDTQLLFVSPSGNGLKWIISIDATTTPHGDYFTAVANYILQTYDIAVDKSGRDVSRACFLPYDPQAFINPIHLKKS